MAAYGSYGQKKYGEPPYIGNASADSPPPVVRLSRLSVETAAEGSDAALRLSRLSVEATLEGADSAIRLSRLSVEVIVKRGLGPTWSWHYGSAGWQVIG